MYCAYGILSLDLASEGSNSMSPFPPNYDFSTKLYVIIIISLSNRSSILKSIKSFVWVFCK